jgi:hypothetical protein
MFRVVLDAPMVELALVREAVVPVVRGATLANKVLRNTNIAAFSAILGDRLYVFLFFALTT